MHFPQRLFEPASEVKSHGFGRVYPWQERAKSVAQKGCSRWEAAPGTQPSISEGSAVSCTQAAGRAWAAQCDGETRLGSLRLCWQHAVTFPSLPPTRNRSALLDLARGQITVGTARSPTSAIKMNSCVRVTLKPPHVKTCHCSRGSMKLRQRQAAATGWYVLVAEVLTGSPFLPEALVQLGTASLCLFQQTNIAVAKSHAWMAAGPCRQPGTVSRCPPRDGVQPGHSARPGAAATHL